MHKRRGSMIFLPLFMISITHSSFGQEASGDLLRVTILGSGGGPSVDAQHYGPSVLVEAADTLLLFDAGRGTSLRLHELGISPARVNRLFLTHLHSDHVVAIPDLLLTGWANGRSVSFEVWGPSGTGEMMDKLLEAFQFDIRMRRDVDERLPSEGITVLSTNIEEGVVFEDGELIVSAFAVDHGPVEPAYGYRIDYGDYSVALSGDTRFSENLIEAARGVDVLVHEAIDAQTFETAFRRQARGLTDERIEEVIQQVINHHTTIEETGEVFRRVNPRLAVYAHAPPLTEARRERVRRAYSGALVGAADLLTINISETISVSPRAH